MFKSLVLILTVLKGIHGASNTSASCTTITTSCTTYTTELVSTHTSVFYVVNDIPAADADAAHEFPVSSCQPFFNSPYDSFSCHNKTAIPDQYSCCFENYGILMQTQFWDFDEDLLAVAKSNDSAKISAAEASLQHLVNVTADVAHSFTIHGLWNDLCDGSYRSNCDPSLEISNDKDNITHVIVDTFNEPDLYNYMIKYWVNNDKSNVPNGGSISLWEHEYNKHGTCMNTLLPKCFTGNYTRFENTVSFYKKVVELFKNLDTYQFLAQDGIVPSLRKQYKLSDVKNSLAKNHADKNVYVGCLNGTIDEIWYYHSLHGGVLTGDYKPSDSITNDTCPSNVWYIPKTLP